MWNARVDRSISKLNPIGSTYKGGKSLNQSVLGEYHNFGAFSKAPKWFNTTRALHNSTQRRKAIANNLSTCMNFEELIIMSSAVFASTGIL